MPVFGLYGSDSEGGDGGNESLVDEGELAEEPLDAGFGGVGGCLGHIICLLLIDFMQSLK